MYLVPGSKFLSREFGWFRIIFSVDPEHLKEALRRLEKLLVQR